jgi:hypothetical protein
VDPTTIGWIGAGIAGLIFLDALFVELRRALREGKRLATRLAGYAELPIFAQVATMEGDADRLVRALDALAPLMERAAEAWLVVRTLGRTHAADAYRPNGTFPD